MKILHETATSHDVEHHAVYGRDRNGREYTVEYRALVYWPSDRKRVELSQAIERLAGIIVEAEDRTEAIEIGDPRDFRAKHQTDG